MTATARIKIGNTGKDKSIACVEIPDLWHIANCEQLNGVSIGGVSAKDLILQCWNDAHDMKNHIINSK